MRIATLQFSPRLGDVQGNIARADALIEAADLEGKLELLVGPELGMSGYNFPSLSAISPYLEPTAAGPTARWAFATAKRLGCVVSIGYPERATREGERVLRSLGVLTRGGVAAGVSAGVERVEYGTRGDNTPATRPQVLATQEQRNGSGVPVLANGLSTRAGEDRRGDEEKYAASIYNYNSTLTVSPTGEVLAHYRKTHLYYTDETWALPSPSGWLTTDIPLPSTPSIAPMAREQTTAVNTASASTTSPPISVPNTTTNAPPSITGIFTSPTPPATTSLTTTTFGICMDLNPHLFLAPWNRYEFAAHALASNASLVVCSMAWLARLPAEEPGLLPPSSDRTRATESARPHSGPGEDEDEPAQPATARTASRAQPDTDIFAYWLDRLTPLIAAPKLTTVVIANRCGVEPGHRRAPKRTASAHVGPAPARPAFKRCARFGPPAIDIDEAAAVDAAAGGKGVAEGREGGGAGSEGADGANALGQTGEARYAGTSCVLRVGAGQVEVLGLMGRGEEGVGVVDTDDFPQVRA
ncbi:Carbon-nitrogen hydrolase [Trapelia coarctata]|nr:Carbon-nitrogen hydrolase [Trapelia coarctata]